MYLTLADKPYILWIALGLVLLAVILLYLLGRGLAPHKPTPEKLKSYACGEDMSGSQSQFYPNSFIYAIYFTIFDILAFVIATAMVTLTQGIEFSAIAAIFAGIGLLGVVTLRR
ncbi:MAG: NADH-quinone oxidoreductase subunit A [Asgard group archaeon]|nr:NADH-quinone oxidoreductase subunit A [Asgard group archaeon]